MTTTGWRIDPDTLSLTNPDAPDRFTAEQFAAQQWPHCPECGRTVHVDRIPVPDGPWDLRPKYLIGTWHCPSECKPRGADLATFSDPWR